MTTASARPFAAVSLGEIDRGNRLLAAYLAGDAAARALLPEAPPSTALVAGRADRAAVMAALVAYQQAIGADSVAVEHARLLGDPATAVVTVGQQPGLLTGPLYTPFKALTAIAVARRQAQQSGGAGVPVFWIGADDDDRAEIDHCACWEGGGRLHTIQYPEAAGAPGMLVGDLPIGAHGEAVLAEVEPLLAGQPFAEEVRAILQEALAASADLGEWFARLMTRLCAGMGLVMCDSRLPALRPLAAEIIRRELMAPLATTRALAERAAALRQMGFAPALTKPADTCNVFLIVDGCRQRITYQDGSFHVADECYTQEALLSLLQTAPERFIPNAVLRPVVQEYLFGSAAFIAGPNELCYWAELQPVFAALGVPMPPVLPRAAATLVPAAAARQLRAWEVAPLDLLHAYDRVRYALLTEEAPASVRQQFAEARDEIARLVARLADAAAVVEPTLAQSATATNQRMLNELERLEHKVLKAVERRATEQSGRLAQVRDLLFPGAGLQERALNIFSAMARFGPDLPMRLLELLDGQEGQHVFVEL